MCVYSLLLNSQCLQRPLFSTLRGGSVALALIRVRKGVHVLENLRQSIVLSVDMIMRNTLPADSFCGHSVYIYYFIIGNCTCPTAVHHSRFCNSWSCYTLLLVELRKLNPSGHLRKPSLWRRAQATPFLRRCRSCVVTTCGSQEWAWILSLLTYLLTVPFCFRSRSTICSLFVTQSRQFSSTFSGSLPWYLGGKLDSPDYFSVLNLTVHFKFCLYPEFFF